MFKITSTKAITWPSFALLKGENTLLSRKAVPAELWPKLDRFRSLKLLDFEGEASAGDGKDDAKLEELTQKQLYDMGKAELAELAKASGVSVAEGASKKDLLDALAAKGATASGMPSVTVDPTSGGKAVVTNRRSEKPGVVSGG